LVRPGGDRRARRPDTRLRGDGGRRDGVTAPLDGIDLVVFDKDGTLIDFHAMWSAWPADLATRLEAATGRDLRAPLFAMLGYDAETERPVANGRLAAAPMTRIRDATLDVLLDAGLSAPEAH